MPQIIFTEQELNRLQELETEKKDLNKQYCELVIERNAVVDAYTQKLSAIANKFIAANKELAAIQQSKEETF